MLISLIFILSPLQNKRLHFNCLTVLHLFSCVHGLLVRFCAVSFNGEGPRSRRYGRTAALSLIVQPCDED
jgi:hypothetical protein